MTADQWHFRNLVRTHWCSERGAWIYEPSPRDTASAHTLGDVLEDMILGYSRRDTDGTRQGGDAKAAPVPKHCQAGAEGIARNQSQSPKGVI